MLFYDDDDLGGVPWIQMVGRITPRRIYSNGAYYFFFYETVLTVS